MIMTDEQKYNAVLKELGELLQSKNTTISCQRWQIDELKAKLEAAEKERDAANAKRSAIAKLYEINDALMECVDVKKGAILNVDRFVALQTDILNILHRASIEGGAA